jgi:DNA polymerase-3 subunit epsilon
VLQLTRPLVCADLETTGINTAKDRIVQIGIVKLMPDGELKEWSSFVNPECAIPKEASDVHHITEEKLKGAPTFRMLAPVLIKGFEDVDFAGYNIKAFDLPFMVAEFARAGHTFDPTKHYVVDGFKIFLSKHPRNLTSAVKEFLNEDFGDSAHDALNDARVSLRVIQAQLARHGDLPRTPAELHAHLFNPKGNNLDSDGKFYFENGEVIMNFGKYRGSSLRLVDKGYLQWVVGANFPDEVKKICRDAIAGNFPRPPQ